MVTVNVSVRDTSARKNIITGTLTGELPALAALEERLRKEFDDCRVHFSSPIASSVRPEPRKIRRAAKRTGDEVVKTLQRQAEEMAADLRSGDLSRPDRFEPQ